ncbi:DNA primase, large subunit, partial [Exidia glandulosa HHB12029]
MISREKRAAASAAASPYAHLTYQHRLNFYDEPPRYNITLDEFESCAIDRLRILSEIESCLARNRSPEDMKTVIDAQCRKFLPLDANTASKLVDVDAQRKRDHLGHFVLRLAFCRSEELRRRFVKSETMLFRIRYELADQNEVNQFLESKKFAWEKASNGELQSLKSELIAVHPRLPWPENGSPPAYYKVNWTSVPDLVAQRKVLLRLGKAYVPATEQESIVLQEFQERIESNLDRTAKALPRLDEDDRILPILGHLADGLLAGIPMDSSFAVTEGDGVTITADMIEDLSRKHFPLCMRNLHDNLRKDKHLKHAGRLQYTLFLKGFGLTLDEAIVFWRKSYRGGKVKDDDFNKEYKYNIRHSYGQEGKRADYPPMNCARIITSQQPSAQESHGCPFKHFSIENLDTALLTKYGSCGMNSSALPEINKYVKDGHYHVACTRVYEITHNIRKGEGLGGGESVTHPNLY